MLLQNLCFFCLMCGFCSGMVTDGSSDYTGAIVLFNYTDAINDDNATTTVVLGSPTVEAGSYGGHSPKVNVSGIVTLPFSDLHDDGDKFGCNSNYPHVEPGVEWVALIARGHCKFSTKILNAQRRNASAVLIYDYEGEPTITIMSHHEADDIVAISINNLLGRNAAVAAQKGYAVYVTITTGCSHSYVRSIQLSKTSFVFVSASFIVLMLVSFAWVLFYYIERFRSDQVRTSNKKRRVEAAKKMLASLPPRSLKQNDDLIVEGVCVICLSSYKGGDRVRDLPCRHTFHKKCVDPWLQDKHTCPMCKMDIVKVGVASKTQASSNVAMGGTESQNVVSPLTSTTRNADSSRAHDLTTASADVRLSFATKPTSPVEPEEVIV